MTDIINHFKRRNPDPAVQAAAFALVADVLQDRRLRENLPPDECMVVRMDGAALKFAAASSDARRQLG